MEKGTFALQLGVYQRSELEYHLGRYIELKEKQFKKNPNPIDHRGIKIITKLHNKLQLLKDRRSKKLVWKK